MKQDIRSALRQIRGEIRESDRRDGWRWVIDEFSSNLAELGARYTAGDTRVVDEFLDLYCLRPADKGPRIPVASLDLPRTEEPGNVSPTQDR